MAQRVSGRLPLHHLFVVKPFLPRLHVFLALYGAAVVRGPVGNVRKAKLAVQTLVSRGDAAGPGAHGVGIASAAVVLTKKKPRLSGDFCELRD
jgi:hypothetical protein